MVIDTSALIAIAFGEPEEAEFVERIAADPVRLVSAASVLEAILVIATRRSLQMARELDDFLADGGFEIVPFDEAQLAVAREAFFHYGTGNHPAGLNFGDCFAYALAVTRGEPLLFKGADFAQTDITAA